MPKNAAPRPAEPEPAAVLPPAAPSPAPRAATRAAVLSALAERTGLSKQEVASVFLAMGDLAGRELGARGPGRFVVPGLLRLRVVRKPAKPAEPGVNPFTKQPITLKARPARSVLKAVPMKALKGLI